MDTVDTRSASVPEDGEKIIEIQLERLRTFKNHPFKVRMDQLILETVQTEKDMIRIAGEYYPAGFVKGKLLKLNYSHIEYVLECMDKNTTKVRNIKQYLLAALFNAPSTIGSYYKAEVNHDMPQYAN